MKFSSLFFILSFLFLFTFVCSGQVETFFIQPNQLDPNYSITEDSFPISINTSGSINKLFLFLGGTGSNPSNVYTGVRLHAANLGFDVINLTYPNTVPAVLLADSQDDLAFNDYREEICFGTPGSIVVSVDSLNSIATRTLKTIQYLITINPSHNWSQYLTDSDTIDWSKIIIGGHSQGSGHAAYLGKRFLMDRILMFSGPNDYSDFFDSPADWLMQEGATPANRHYGFLHLEDEVVDFSKQYANLSELGLVEQVDSTSVENQSAPYNNALLLFTNQIIGGLIINHSVPVTFNQTNRDAWTYMLTSDIITNLELLEEEKTILIFPNPTKELLFLKSNENLEGKSYVLQNIFGQKILSGNFFFNQNTLDLSQLNTGIYLLSIDDFSLKIIKE